MIDNIKPVDSLTVADFRAHPVWEFSIDDPIEELVVRPVESIPVESLDLRVLGSQVRLANGLEVWAMIGNFDVTDPRATRQFVTLSFERGGKWFHLARYFEFSFADQGPEALARFLDLGVDEVFPIFVDVRRYVRGNPAALTTIVLKEPQEKLTEEEIGKLLVRARS